MKLDGYRVQAIHGSRFQLLSRRGNASALNSEKPIEAVASAVPAGSVIDGELVAIGATINGTDIFLVTLQKLT